MLRHDNQWCMNAVYNTTVPSIHNYIYPALLAMHKLYKACLFLMHEIHIAENFALFYFCLHAVKKLFHSVLNSPKAIRTYLKVMISKSPTQDDGGMGENKMTTNISWYTVPLPIIYKSAWQCITSTWYGKFHDYWYIQLFLFHFIVSVCGFQFWRKFFNQEVRILTLHKRITCFQSFNHRTKYRTKGLKVKNFFKFFHIHKLTIWFLRRKCRKLTVTNR